MNTPKQVAKSLKNVILDNFDSMQTFAISLNISPSNLSNIVSGKSYLSAKNSLKFANILGLNPRYLACGEEPMYMSEIEFDSTGYKYSIKPIILASLNTTTEERELINLVLRDYYPRKTIVRAEFYDNDDTRFRKMIDAALSLAGKIIDLSILDSTEIREFNSRDHGDNISIYKRYAHFIDGLLIKTNYRNTRGYIEFIVFPDFIEISDY